MKLSEALETANHAPAGAPDQEFGVPVDFGQLEHFISFARILQEIPIKGNTSGG